MALAFVMFRSHYSSFNTSYTTIMNDPLQSFIKDLLASARESQHYEEDSTRSRFVLVDDNASLFVPNNKRQHRRNKDALDISDHTKKESRWASQTGDDQFVNTSPRWESPKRHDKPRVGSSAVAVVRDAFEPAVLETPRKNWNAHEAYQSRSAFPTHLETRKRPPTSTNISAAEIWIVLLGGLGPKLLLKLYYSEPCLLKTLVVEHERTVVDVPWQHPAVAALTTWSGHHTCANNYRRTASC